MRSRAVSFPRSCWRWTAASLPAWQRLLPPLLELAEPLLDGVGARVRCGGRHVGILQGHEAGQRTGAPADAASRVRPPGR